MTPTTTQNLIERPPVVVVMGHIDHGKSTLLDYIRKSNTVDGEAGGITQHIAAYEVLRKDQKKITFIDTPGHATFRHVRSRGASIADIAILIVSAEDGVMPQTKEALDTIKEDGMPFIVAINKIDTEKANIEKTQASLIENEVYLEGMGGDISYVKISAKTGEGIDDLMDTINLISEVEEFKADPKRPAEGIVLEAHKDTNTGISSTLIIKDGTLKKGNFIACESSMSPVRAIDDHNGKKIDEATFSSPIIVSGWSDLPEIGSVFKTFENKKEAEAYCKGCKKKTPEKSNVPNSKSDKEIIPIIIKTDVSGTGEAIVHEIKELNTDKIEFKIIKTATGNISEADIKLAAGKEGTLVVGFGVKVDTQAEALRERDGIETKIFNIIYELTDWLKEVSVERTPMIETEEIIGQAKILKIFNKAKNTQVIGGKMKEGSLKVGVKVKIMRRNEMIGEGVMKELQQQKVKSTEVSEGEFGAAIETKTEIAESDHLEAIQIVKK